MNLKIRILFFILILTCIKTGFSQMANSAVLKDGQNISLDSFKLSQRDCIFSFYPSGIKKELTLCLENVVVIYDSKGSTRDFRPCICDTPPIALVEESVNKPRVVDAREEEKRKKEEEKMKKEMEKKLKKEENKKKKEENKKKEKAAEG